MYSSVHAEMRKTADPEKGFLSFILNLICFLFKELLIFLQLEDKIWRR